ncbi:hypothetical protein Tco_0613700 [Tanacetum coccineum]
MRDPIRSKQAKILRTQSATSSNHAKILAIHEASRECVWLRSMTQHIRESCGISLGQESPTVVHEDNATCIAQLKDRYIKGDKTKHILPKFFFTHDLQKSGDIIVQKVHSSDNQADLSTKALPTTTFKRSWFTTLECEDSINLSDLIIRGRIYIRGSIYALHSFFLSFGFVPQGFPSKVFNEATHLSVWEPMMDSQEGVL